MKGGFRIFSYVSRTSEAGVVLAMSMDEKRGDIRHLSSEWNRPDQEDLRWIQERYWKGWGPIFAAAGAIQYQTTEGQ